MKKRFVLAIIITIIILLVGCSIDESEEAKKIKEKAKQIAEEQAKLKEEKYQKAILDLNENITTNNTIKTNLDKRYDILKKQIDKINSGEKELDFASFVRFKIELDFLKVQKYNSKKLQLLSNNFVKAYTKTKEQVKEEDHGSSSLNDRYFSLERKIEKISSGKNELKITEYISIEKELNDLDKDGYIKNRITEQRSKLLKIVITAIESAVVDFDIPEVEEEKEEKETKIEEAKDKAKPQVEIFEEEVDEEGFMVKLINGGFDTNTMHVQIGTTVVWKNERTGRFQIALVLGNKECRGVKSKIFKSGETFNYTFNKPVDCFISDGIFTTQAMRVIAE